MPLQTVVFDVNETLSDMRPMAGRFTDLGAPAHLAPLWFTSTLREGIGLAASGDYQPFATVAAEVTRTLLTGVAIDRDLDSAVRYVLDGFLALPLHPDVAAGIRLLADAGLRLVTLSNGGLHVAEKLLGDAGLRGHFDHVLSVDGAGIWKPAPGAYAYAARVCEADPADLLMVAVHPWDLHGAARAGLATAWVDREGLPYPRHVRTPDHTVRSLVDLAERLG
jgi:2-haloacid dehalogenase